MLGTGSTLWRLGGPLARRALKGFVRRTQTEWARAGRVIHWGPVSAVCTASLPGWSGGGIDGALGLVDGGLVFAGRRASACDGALPFEALRWVGLRRARGWGRGGRRLAVHAERSGRWHVAVFALDEIASFAEALAAHAGLPLEDAGAGREDFGPDRALRLVEDVYGEWHAEREGTLYLAPDRLLFDWRDAILLDTIEQIGVVERAPGKDDVLRSVWRAIPQLYALTRAPGENERGEVLRVMHRIDAETYDVVGFSAPQAEAWAEAIAARASGRLAVGRKKKDG